MKHSEAIRILPRETRLKFLADLRNSNGAFFYIWQFNTKTGKPFHKEQAILEELTKLNNPDELLEGIKAGEMAVSTEETFVLSKSGSVTYPTAQPTPEEFDLINTADITIFKSQ